MVKFNTLILSLLLLFASPTFGEDAPEIPEIDQQEIHCLTEAMYFEARGEPHIGRLAVAHVIVNRTKSNRFPDSVCGVIRQKGQFSYNPVQKVRESHIWGELKMVAEYVLRGQGTDPSKGSLFFGTLTQQYICTEKQKRIIGNHRFC